MLLVGAPKNLPGVYVFWISDLLIISCLSPEAPEPPPPPLTWGKYFNLEEMLQFSGTRVASIRETDRTEIHEYTHESQHRA